MAVLSKALQVLSDNGGIGIVSRGAGYVYRNLRPVIPGGYPARLGGVFTCYDHKWTDKLVPTAWLPWRLVYELENYEAGLLSGLRQHVGPGDRIVVVGGGIGVTAVCAALLSGPAGHVECYEGSLEQCSHIRETAARNKVANIRVHHGVVASNIAVFGDPSEVGGIIPPEQLPDCDILELDCEGSEVQILREMTIRPRVLVIETHGVFGAPTALVRSLMEAKDYAVTDLGLAEPSLQESCEQDDVRVLVGVRTTHS